MKNCERKIKKKDAVKDIWDLLDEDQYILIKTDESFNVNYIEHERFEDIYLQHISQEEYLQKMRQYLEDITEKLKNTWY